MNATDPLDELLGQSSPITVTITPGVQRDLEVMTRAAAREVATTAPSRWTTRLVVGFGRPRPDGYGRRCHRHRRLRVAALG